MAVFSNGITTRTLPSKENMVACAEMSVLSCRASDGAGVNAGKGLPAMHEVPPTTCRVQLKCALPACAAKFVKGRLFLFIPPKLTVHRISMDLAYCKISKMRAKQHLPAYRFLALGS